MGNGNITLVGIVQKLAKKMGTEEADNLVAGVLLVKKDYFSLKDELVRVYNGMVKSGK
ncbi:hypothetical protein [Phosphitispora fastidiosa]|uniref:hypothetical protein n=1 Tax=Phosphitispora fastidiosa TaxID=2837202 RepID=UPI001E283716|nr:hypothetical protein [Phosphitispora fastidiosa]MBU7006317.1 hypothetical protein [Phosphitispora fastidiosa]